MTWPWLRRQLFTCLLLAWGITTIVVIAVRLADDSSLSPATPITCVFAWYCAITRIAQDVVADALKQRSKVR